MDEKEKDETHGYLMTVELTAQTLRRMLHHEPTVDVALLRRVLGVIARRHDTKTSLVLRGLLTQWMASSSREAREAPVARMRELVGPKETKR